MLDCLVIGAGIVGLAAAREFQARHPGAAVAVIDKETNVATHQSGHNSGVVHAGVYYAPGSLKARLCRRGITATLAFCEEHAIPMRRPGKLIVATDGVEVERLRALAARAADNGLACTWLDAAAIREREPRVDGRAALYVGETAITDYPALCRRLADLVVANGGEVVLGEEVRAIAEQRDRVAVETVARRFDARRLAVCGGLQADRLARLAGLAPDCAIVPFRGDYYRLPAARAGLVDALIYPVPDPRLPFLGVHLTPTVDGALTVGPTAMLAGARERYRKWAFEARDFRETLRWPGTWRVLARYPRAGAGECLHALSRRAYLQAARRYCPALELADLAQHRCGIRAQAVTRSGELVSDFLFARGTRSVHVLNAPSPAATSAFPIAAEIVAELGADA